MAQYELSLFDYWRILKRRKFIVISTFGLIMFFTWVFTRMQPHIFQATATIKVEPSLIVPGVATEALGWDILTAINTEVRLIKSAVVSKKVAKRIAAIKLGLINENSSEEEKSIAEASITDDQIHSLVGDVGAIQAKIDAERVGDTNLIRIIATSSEKDETALLANITAEVYIQKGIEDRSRRAKQLREFIEKQMIDAKEKLRESEEKLRKYIEETRTTGVGGHLAMKLIELETTRAELLKRYTEKHPDVVNLTSKIKIIEEQMRQLPKEELEYARLTREMKLNEDLYALLAKRHKEAQISEADRVQSAFIVTPATVPKFPIKPNPVTNFSIGGILGIFIGVIFAFVIEHLDTSIGTIEDVETYLQLPVIGVIPHIEQKHKATIGSQLWFIKPTDKVREMRTQLIIYHSAKSPFVEVYHTLRANIKFGKEELAQAPRCLLFTSSGVNEGKTLTGLNFALASAQSGIKTVFIELDLRRPSVHRVFGINRVPGFTDCVFGKFRWQEVVRGTTDFLLGEIELEKVLRAPGIENFKIISCGMIPANPVDVFSSPETERIINELREQFDLVVLDTSPVLLFADALILSPFCDGVIVIYRVGRIARGALKRAKDQLLNVKAKVFGVVLNDIKASEMEPRYGYYYAYKYYVKEEKVK